MHKAMTCQCLGTNALVMNALINLDLDFGTHGALTYLGRVAAHTSM